MTQRQPACSSCTGNPPRYACNQCGREDNRFGACCATCTLRTRLTALMSMPGGGVHPQLLPVFDTLMAGPRPQSTLFWMTRRATGPNVLRRMANGDLPITHAAFDQLPTDRATEYIRDLLTSTGVLPPFDEQLARVPRWLEDHLQHNVPEASRLYLRRYATWVVLQRLRRQEAAGTITRGGVLAARSDIIAVTRFLTWLDDHHISLDDLTQRRLDRFANDHLANAKALQRFLRWTVERLPG